MPRLNVAALRNELLRAGISPTHVRRTLTELNEHFEDLVDERLIAGCDRDEAEQQALQSLGPMTDVATAMLDQPQLKSWAWRWPRVAVVVYPLACVAALPVVPLIVGVEHAESITRWTLGLLLAALVTATMFLVLQLAITLT
ncbi:MAG: permease prefix domain 1-containing protein [Gammaproteobacteria bacterium]|nr:permease prefix domain 1-containing protein [Gammaproteobacteria bacterium]